MTELRLSLAIAAALAGAVVFKENGAGWMVPFRGTLVGLAMLNIRRIERRRGREPPGLFIGILFFAAVCWLVILSDPLTDFMFG